MRLALRLFAFWRRVEEDERALAELEAAFERHLFPPSSRGWVG